MIELLKAVLFGIVEGITEWLPISSTGHLILLDEIIKLNASKEFMEMFNVVIQLGAILAVVLMFWNKIWPFEFHNKPFIKQDIFMMWVKIAVASIPAGVVGMLFDNFFEEHFHKYLPVAIALIVFGVFFIIVENRNKNKAPRICSLSQIGFDTAFIIGIWQMIAAIFPGTSRSGATIIGGLLLGLSRTIAAEFTFFMAIPAMVGASLFKLLKFGFTFETLELCILLVGMIVSFLVSVFVIKFLMTYIKKHDFKVFGWYRIVLGILVIVVFTLKQLIA